jgi:transcriptional regulator with XRE-family HTH domain
MNTAIEIVPGDLARRIAYRRRELGLTVEDLARQAGVDPGFLEYFEQHSDAQLGSGTLNRIARVLQISPTSLLGGDKNRALGRGSALPGAILEPLTPAQCRAHLRDGGVGRVIFRASRGPVAFPVNFRFSNGEVLLNTTVNTAIELESQGTVGFEIDRIDDVFSEGWSVIVTGSARLVDHPDELVEHAAHGIVPWGGGSPGGRCRDHRRRGHGSSHRPRRGRVSRQRTRAARPLDPSVPRPRRG